MFCLVVVVSLGHRRCDLVLRADGEEGEEVIKKGA